MSKRILDYGVKIGSMERGALNKISDVPGVTVGHATLSTQRHHTGVTVVMPCTDNPFSHKLTASAHVFNGFGKTAGLIQVEELGTLETPIALTNTLNVGRIHDAMVGYMISLCGPLLTSVNPVICECNDARLNDIQERVLNEQHLLEAIGAAEADFEEGAVGAGAGTSCHGLKGGIGSASRIMTFPFGKFTLGVLVQTNHGILTDLMIEGKPAGRAIAQCQAHQTEAADKGSCIIIAATDLPVSDRQLKRIIRRAGVGLNRLGSYLGHGSGEIAVGFTTANRVNEESLSGFNEMRTLDEAWLDIPFRAMAEATEEAILNAMAAAKTTTGFSGVTRHALSEYIEQRQ